MPQPAPITVLGEISWAVAALAGCIAVAAVTLILLRATRTPFRTAAAVAVLSCIAVLAGATALGDALGFF